MQTAAEVVGATSTGDFLARLNNVNHVACCVRPMSHLRFYRAILLQTLPLSSCTLRLCRVNKHGFCTSFPVSRSSFTNTAAKLWHCSISNLFWTLRLIVRFHFARQPAKTKLLPRMSVISHVGLVCLRDEVAACNCTVARCDFIARQRCTTKSRDKIAGVTSP